MSENEIWAAGFLSGMGSFFLKQRDGIASVSLTVRSRVHKNAVIRFGQIVGANPTLAGEGMKLTISGKPLHDAMKRLWDYLPYERKTEYARLRKAAALVNEDTNA